jgi:hypothetical protein
MSFIETLVNPAWENVDGRNDGNISAESAISYEGIAQYEGHAENGKVTWMPFLFQCWRLIGLPNIRAKPNPACHGPANVRQAALGRPRYANEFRLKHIGSGV